MTVSREAPANQVYNAQDFKIHEQDRARPQQASGSPEQERPSTGGPESQSEKDWRYALRNLKTGEDPNQIIRDMASYRSEDLYDKNDPAKLVAETKPKPYYYAEQTVTKAMASLGMTMRPARTAKAAASSRETETVPSR